MPRYSNMSCVINVRVQKGDIFGIQDKYNVIAAWAAGKGVFLTGKVPITIECIGACDDGTSCPPAIKQSVYWDFDLSECVGIQDELEEVGKTASEFHRCNALCAMLNNNFDWRGPPGSSSYDPRDKQRRIDHRNEVEECHEDCWDKYGKDFWEQHHDIMYDVLKCINDSGQLDDIEKHYLDLYTRADYCACTTEDKTKLSYSIISADIAATEKMSFS